MAARRGVLVAYVFTTLLQQPVTQLVRWAPPPPCAGDSTETHARRGRLIVVPKLDSMSLLHARAMLTKLGLKIDVRTVRMDGPAGVVIGQAPQSGSFVASGDAVIVCARQSPVFPNVVGLTFDAARTVLRDAGYDAIKTSSFVDRDSRVGIVFRQQPAAGGAAPRGSVDTLVVGVASSISTMVPPGAPQPRQPQPPPALRPQKAAPESSTQPPLSSPNASIDDDEPMDWSWLWKLALGAGVLLAAVARTIKMKDRRRLAALRVVPRQHPGRPRVVVATSARREASND